MTAVSYLNTVGYFLRVPDGHWSGDGYYETGFQSLKRLATGENEGHYAVKALLALLSC